jgi:hypothetical protein
MKGHIINRTDDADEIPHSLFLRSLFLSFFALSLFFRSLYPTFFGLFPRASVDLIVRFIDLG